MLYYMGIRDRLWFFIWRVLLANQIPMLTFTTSLVLILSSVSGSQSALAANPVIESSSIIEAASHMVLTAEPSVNTPTASTPIVKTVAKTTTRAKTSGPSVEGYVRAYFTKAPILAEIAFCESRFTHFTDSGEILRGRIVPDDLGVMQINKYYHGKTADKLGIDLYTLDGNLAYAKYLYDTQGVQPWSASAPCWDKSN
jgi:hypothetical protein